MELHFQNRLLSRFVRSEGCWVWQGKPDTTTGYGQITAKSESGRKKLLAHRAVYQLLVGDIPKGKVLDHLCRNKLCVNPSHLEPTSVGENVLRGETIAAKNKAKTHCKNGHKLTKENTYQPPSWDNKRMCKTCSDKRSSLYHSKQYKLDKVGV